MLKNTHLNSGGYFISQILNYIPEFSGEQIGARNVELNSLQNRLCIGLTLRSPSPGWYCTKNTFGIFTRSKARASFSIILDVLERCMHVVLYSVDKNTYPITRDGASGLCRIKLVFNENMFHPSF